MGLSTSPSCLLNSSWLFPGRTRLRGMQPDYMAAHTQQEPRWRSRRRTNVVPGTEGLDRLHIGIGILRISSSESVPPPWHLHASAPAEEPSSAYPLSAEGLPSRLQFWHWRKVRCVRLALLCLLLVPSSRQQTLNLRRADGYGRGSAIYLTLTVWPLAGQSLSSYLL